MNSELEYILGIFNRRYGKPGIVVASPGRINILGEHVDYNDGYVLPAAINLYIWGAFAPSQDGQTHIFAANLGREVSFDISQVHSFDYNDWGAYIIGVIMEMQKRGAQPGNFNLVFGGNVPLGAGLSSSAALENCVAYGLNKLFDLGFDRRDLIFISQQAEHNYANVQCGIMDQFATMFGKEDNVIFLDTQTLDYQYLPIRMKEYEFVLVNSNVKHSLVGSEYNMRRQQCQQGLEIIKKHHGRIGSFRDIEPGSLDQIKPLFDPQVYKRVKYVVEEIYRTQKAREAIIKSDWQRLGALMTETHQGLRDLYEVSCKELDFLVDTAIRHEAVIGSRMMGGGFGGCTLNLVNRKGVDDFVDFITSQYSQHFTFKADIYRVKIVDGTHEVEA